MTIRTIAKSMALVALVAAATTAAPKPVLEVGNKTVKGTKIKPFTATWTSKQHVQGNWMEVGTITETVSMVEVDGREVMKREQVSVIPPIEGKKTETLLFDPKTLEPIRLSVESSGKFPPPATQHSDISFNGKYVKGKVTSFAGETREVDQNNDGPMFEAAMLGLVIAALPLEDGYVAELPVNFVMQGSVWVVRATVTGTKDYKMAGKSVSTWEVRTDWRDVASDDGYPDDDSGGKYYVTTNPPDGFPYVARYVNPHVDIDVKLD